MLASAAALAEGLQQPLPPDERAQRVDALFAPWDTDDAPGAVVAVYEDEKLAYAKGYGIANLDLGVPLTPQSALRVGSISKQFIGMCIALLAEEGKLDFDESVRRYLPELPKYAAPITVRHLLHHTSGLREYLSLVELIGKPEGGGYPYTNDEVIELLARQEALLFPPGTAESYSNSNYFLLAEIVKRVSGVTTSAFAKAHIFEPLGMVNTRFADNPNAIIPNRAWGYSPIGDDQFRSGGLLTLGSESAKQPPWPRRQAITRHPIYAGGAKRRNAVELFARDRARGLSRSAYTRPQRLGSRLRCSVSAVP